MSIIRITPSNIDSAFAALLDGDSVILASGVYKRSKTLNVTADRISIAAESGAVLHSTMKGGKLLALKGDDIVVDRLGFSSDRPYGSTRPQAIVVLGKRAVIHRCSFVRVFYCVLLESAARHCIVRDIDMPFADGALNATYVCYFKGLGHVMENLTVDRSVHTAIRGNLYQNVTVRNLRVTGGFVKFQKGDGATMSDSHIDSAWLIVGPLNNKDGVRGDGGPKPFLASRTRNVSLARIEFSGKNAELQVDNRSDGVHIDEMSGQFKFQFRKATKISYLAGNGYPAGSVISPRAVNVWMNGEKIG